MAATYGQREGRNHVLVPQRIEPARRTKEMSDAAVNARQSGTQKDGSRDFRSAIDQAAPEFRDDLARLTDWAESLEAEGLARLATRKGNSGSTSLKPLLHSGGVALVTITCDVKSSYMQFFRSVFERRAPEAMPAVEAALGAKITQGNSTRVFTEELLKALTNAYREAHDNPEIQAAAELFACSHWRPPPGSSRDAAFSSRPLPDQRSRKYPSGRWSHQ